MNKKSLIFLLLVVAAGAVFVFARKSEVPIAGISSSKRTFYDSELLEKLPPATLAFYSWRSDVPALRKLQESAAVQGLDSLIAQIDKLPIDPSQQRLLKSVGNTLMSSGLIARDAHAEHGLTKLLAFAAGSSGLPDAGVYLTSKDSVDLKGFGRALKSDLEKEQIPVAEETAGPRLKMTVSQGPMSFHMLFDDHKAALATSADLANRMLADEQTGQSSDLLKSDRFKSLVNESQTTSTPGTLFGFGVLDLQAIATLAKGVIPQEEAQNIDEMPFGYVSLAQFADESALHSEALLELMPKNDQQKLLISNVSKPAENTIIDRLPASAAFFLIVDGQLIRTVQEGALSELSPEEIQASQKLVDYLKKVKGISIGALGADREALMPELFIAAQTEKPEDILSFIKEQTQGLISTQIPMANWLSKTINEVPVQYILTPLGIGLYLAAVNDGFFAASSEKGMTALISSAKGSTPTAAANFNALSSLVSPASPLLSGYLDFTHLADAVESVQGSMSLLTGGATALNAEEISNLKRLGNATFGVVVQDRMLRVRWDLKPLS